MMGNPNYFVWSTPSREVALNQRVKFTGENTPAGAPEGVHLTKLGKGGPGVNYGEYNVIIDGSKYQIKPTADALEFRLDGEIPAEDGVWCTKEDMKNLQ